MDVSRYLLGGSFDIMIRHVTNGNPVALSQAGESIGGGVPRAGYQQRWFGAPPGEKQDLRYVAALTGHGYEVRLVRSESLPS